MPATLRSSMEATKASAADAGAASAKGTKKETKSASKPVAAAAKAGDKRARGAKDEGETEGAEKVTKKTAAEKTKATPTKAAAATNTAAPKKTAAAPAKAAAAAAKTAESKKASAEKSSTEEAKKPAKKATSTASQPKAAKSNGAVVDADLQEDKIALDDADDIDSEAEDNEDDAAILAGFSDGSGADSSDDDDDDDRKVGQITTSGVVKLPSSRDDAVVRSRLDKVHKRRKESGASATPIVLYFGRVPKSMPESALRAYLTQFGDIRRLRLSRNRSTGATKHYAFVEFDDEEVGKIVQETMHNYLLEGRLLQVRVVPKEKQHAALWVGANRAFRQVPADRLFRLQHDKPRTQEQKDRTEKKLLDRQEKRRARLQQQGIDYDFPGYTR